MDGAVIESSREESVSKQRGQSFPNETLPLLTMESSLTTHDLEPFQLLSGCQALLVSVQVHQTEFFSKLFSTLPVTYI